MARRILRSHVVVAGTLAVAALAWSGPAVAQTPPPDDTGLIDQYREVVPTSKGPRAHGGDQGSTSVPLVPTVETQLRAAAGSDAQLLERVATSSRYGAPERAPALPAPVLHDPGGGGNPVAAAFGAVTDADAGHPLGLVAGLFLVTGVALGVAAARRRGSQRPSAGD